MREDIKNVQLRMRIIISLGGTYMYTKTQRVYQIYGRLIIHTTGYVYSSSLILESRRIDIFNFKGIS